MRAMTATEQASQQNTVTRVMNAVAELIAARCEDEDIRVAMARLDDWLSDNDGRWVT